MMDSTLKTGDSPNDNISPPSTSEYESNEPVSENIQSESEGQDAKVTSSVSEVTSVTNTECKEESQIPSSTDNEESLTEISEHLFESSESEVVPETVKESRLDDENVLGKERPETCHNQSASEEVKVQPNDCKTTTCVEETVPKTKEHRKITNTECTAESQIPSSTDNEESLTKLINEHLYELSESEVAPETVKESRFADENVLGKERPETCHNQSASEEVKVQPNDCKTTTCVEETVPKTKEHRKITNTECTAESQIPSSTDNGESLTELINKHLYESSESESPETVKESRLDDENVLGKERPETCHNLSQRQRWPRETRDQCCQANLPDTVSSDKVKMLKEKLAISKKDTDTMQKLLEDVRKDYEELQKSFEKRESDEKNKALAPELTKENNETKKESIEVKRGKTSKRGNKASASDRESRSPDKKKADVTGAEKESLTTSEDFYSSEVTCPCFVESIRKIVTDVREDFKDTISVFKQSSAEHCASIGKELTKLKEEYMCALEKKDSGIIVTQEIIKSLQSRIVDAEREAAAFREVISSSLVEKQKLYDDIRVLKDQLLRTRQENETRQAQLQKIKHGLKTYCTAEEYEELQRSNFKFRADDCSVNEDGGQASEIGDHVSELQNKATKFHPVLKKAKKEIAKLREEKQDAENRLLKKISEGEELESYLNKQLSAALVEMRRKEHAVNELKKELIALKVENAKLNVNIDGLEKEKEKMLKEHGQELETVKNKLKKSNESLQFLKVKNEQMQEENAALNDSFLGLKTYLEEEKAKMLVGMKGGGEYLSDDEDSIRHLRKDESQLHKQLKFEKEKNESCLKEIYDLKEELNQWKKMVRDDMDIGMGFLRIEELKDEIEENQILITQLVAKKKLHVRIIKKLRMENALLKNSCATATDEYDDISFDSCEEIESEEPGSDRTSTQGHRVTFEKNEKKKKPECSENDEDSLFNETKHGVHFSDDNNDFHDWSLEILEYDTSISEKE